MLPLFACLVCRRPRRSKGAVRKWCCRFCTVAGDVGVEFDVIPHIGFCGGNLRLPDLTLASSELNPCLRGPWFALGRFQITGLLSIVCRKRERVLNVGLRLLEKCLLFWFVRTRCCRVKLQVISSRPSVHIKATFPNIDRLSCRLVLAQTGSCQAHTQASSLWPQDCGRPV